MKPEMKLEENGRTVAEEGDRNTESKLQPTVDMTKMYEATKL